MRYLKKKKKLLKLNFKIILLFFFGVTYLYSYNFEIEDYNVEIYLLKNSTVQITETIKVNFLLPRRGIIRYIPYRYKSGIFNDNLRIQLISVESSTNNENFITEPYKIYKKRRNLYIKIGKRNKYWRGIKVYKIIYLVKNVIKGDKFYWNVIGTNWRVPIKRANFTIIYPKIDPELLEVKIWKGKFKGSTELHDFTITEEALYLDKNVYLPPRHGLTVGIAFPKGFFNKPNIIYRLSWFLIDNFGLVLPFLTFFIMIILWNVKGRDEKKGTLVVQYYPPKGMTPAEAGTLIDEKVDLRDIIATILSLADKGYLKIIKKGQKLLFKKIKEPKDELKPHEKIIFNGIFMGKDETSLEDLKRSFFATINSASNYLYELLTDKQKLFSTNPEKTRGIYKKLGINLVIFGIFMLSYGFTIHRWDLGFGIILSGIIVYLFAKIMPKKTSMGMILYNQLKGFKEFMEKVEKPVIQKLIKEDQGYFSKTLPYAIAFNIEKDWVKKFEDLEFKLPDWYVYSGPVDSYTPIIFYSLLANDLNYMHKTFSSIPSGESSFKNIDITGGDFSFGGFSGGGFGGGGGGSW